MKRKFCCDASREMYEDYYMTQSGSGLPIFKGARGQRGHGLGSILSGFFRSPVPFLKRGLKFLGKQALRTGAEIATDVADGKDPAESAKHRVGERIKSFIPGFQTGSGLPRYGLDAINYSTPPFISQSGFGSRKRKIKRLKRDILD